MLNANPQATLEAQMDENAAMLHLIAATTLRRANVCVYGTVNTATDSWTLTLPPVAEAIGQVVFVYATVANSKTLTVADNNDDGGLTDISLNADGEYVVLLSVGKYWINLATAGYS